MTISSPQTIAFLRAIAGAPGDMALLQGHRVPGDGGEGLFRWDPASTAADDNGTVLAPFPARPGRWIRARSGEFNVRWFGAQGDGAADDTRAIQNAIDAATLAGGGVVVIPAGSYEIMPQSPRVQWVAGDALVISGSNVHLRGAGPNATRLRFWNLGHTDPLHHWQIVDGEVWRGTAITLAGGADSQHRQSNITIEDLELDGNVVPGNSGTWGEDGPADPDNGDGWDITHKGVDMIADRYFDNIQIRNCHIHDFRGELVYYGGVGDQVRNFRIEGCHLHGTDGDAISVTAQARIVGNEIWDCANNGIECFFFTDEVIIEGNVIRDGFSGICYQSTWNSGKTVLIANNVIRNMRKWGVFSAREAGPTQIRGNTILDCAVAAIHFETQKGVSEPMSIFRGISITDNYIGVVRQSMGFGVSIANYGDGVIENVDVSRNTFEATQNALAAGYKLGRAFVYNFDGDTTEDVSFTRNLVRNAAQPPAHDKPLNAPVPYMAGNIYIGWTDATHQRDDGIDEAHVTEVPNDEVFEVEAVRPNLDPPSVILDPARYSAGGGVGQILRLRGGSDSRPCKVAYDGNGCDCPADRLLYKGVLLTLQLMRGEDGPKFVEIDFVDPRRFPTVNDPGPRLDARGLATITLRPPAPTTYRVIANIPRFGTLSLVASNGNVTLAHGDGIALAGGADLRLRPDQVVRLTRLADGRVVQV